MKINFGVYYIYCNNDWKSIFTEQIGDIKRSGILDLLKTLYLSINYNTDEDLNFIRNEIDNFSNIKIANTYTENYYEFEALRVVKEICKKYDCNICYIHTKGAGISEKNKNFYYNATDLDHLNKCVASWRRFMESHILYKANHIIEKLQVYDACGVNLCEDPCKHFSGNFWWSKSSHINKLPDIDTLKKSFRWSAEFWIGEQPGDFLNLETNNLAGYKHII